MDANPNWISFVICSVAVVLLGMAWFKRKQRNAQIGWITFWLIVFLLMALGSLSHRSESEKPVAEVWHTLSDPTQTKSTEVNQPQDPTLRLGDDFELGSFGYRVTNVQARRRISDGFTISNASEDATFLLVYYSMSNLGPRSETVDTNALELRDPSGNQYLPDSNAGARLAMSGKIGFFGTSQIHPSFREDTVTAFLVPRSLLASGFDIIVKKQGLSFKSRIVHIEPGSFHTLPKRLRAQRHGKTDRQFVDDPNPDRVAFPVTRALKDISTDPLKSTRTLKDPHKSE